MFDYTSIKLTADRLIKRFGSEVTIRNASGTVSFTTYAVKTKYVRGPLQDTLIDTSDEDAYLVQFNGNVIDPSYYVQFDVNTVRTINKVMEIKPGDTLIMYKLEVAL
jgi:hypothetical protein